MRVSIKLQNRLPLRTNMELARRAEHLGLDGVWVSEYADRDAVTQMSALALATTSISVGASVVPLYTRSATLIGMTAASLAELAPGRLKFGLGVSTNVIVQGWHGTARPAPLAAMREYVGLVRELLATGRAAAAGEVVQSRGFKHLAPDLLQPVELGVAALGPRMCELAGVVGDLALLNLVAADDVPRLRGLVAAGAQGAGRTTPPLVADVRCGLDGHQDGEAARLTLRRLVASYGRVPPYHAHFRRAGFGQQAEALGRAWAVYDAGAAAGAVDDTMLDSLVAIGSAEKLVVHLGRLADAGLDEAIVYPTCVGTDERAVVAQAIEVAAAYGDTARG